MINKDYEKYLKSLFDFMKKNNYTSKPYPKVHLINKKEDDELFVWTGYYDNEKDEICLNTYNRLAKDVLRTFSHELIHWNQRRTGVLNDNDGWTTSLSDKRLEKLESEAYEKGNIAFRKWTEWYQKKNGKE